jgi:hypothetical protein
MAQVLLCGSPVLARATALGSSPVLRVAGAAAELATVQQASSPAARGEPASQLACAIAQLAAC